MKKLLFILVFAILFAGYFHEINAINQDLGRHLIMGKIIAQNWSVTKTNLFSYTYPDYPFINHHWLSEVMFYQIFNIVGFTGLLTFTTLVALLAFLFVYLQAKREASFTILTISSLIYLAILIGRNALRPEIFSFFFLSIFVVVLYRYRENYTRWIFLLPFLEILWVNIHIYFIVGIGVLGLFLIDWFVINLKKPYSKYTSILVFVFFLCLFATLVNPNGISGALYPLRVFQNYGYAVEENQTIFFLWNYSQKQAVAMFMLVFTSLFILLILTMKKVRPIDWMLSISFTIIASIAIRNTPLFVFATFLTFSRQLSILGNNISSILKRDVSSKRLFLIKKLFMMLLLTASIFELLLVISFEHTGAHVPTGAKKAADFFIKNNIKGPLFNNFDIGSYLDYRIYPKDLPAARLPDGQGRQGVVFVDGRPEAYPASFFEETYIPMQEDITKFDQQAKKYNFNSIFFAHTDQTPWAEKFLKQITNSPDWTIVYLDDYVVILVKNVPQNHSLIQKFGMKKEMLHINNYQSSNLISLFQLARFFLILDNKTQAMNAFHDILAINPTFCPGLYTMSLLTRDQPGITAKYTSQYITHCQ